MDAIIPLAQLDQLHADAQFWDARDATNAELAERGLYMTHLFTEADVFLLPDWLSRRVPIPGSFSHLKLLRPAAPDLIPTKMMRGADPEDLSDIEFLLTQEPVTDAELRALSTVSGCPTYRNCVTPSVPPNPKSWRWRNRGETRQPPAEPIIQPSAFALQPLPNGSSCLDLVGKPGKNLTMNSATISTKGQLVIPKSLAESPSSPGR